MGTTYTTKSADLQSRWYLVDLNNKILGRAATKIATLLQGKHKPIYTPQLVCGDFVIAINAGKVKLTGRKLDQKIYFRHSGYPRGDKYMNYKKLMQVNPALAVEEAVKGMLPKNKLRRLFMKRLKIYPNTEYPHQAQAPEPIAI